MPTLGRVGKQLSSLLWRASVDEEVSAELAFHVEMRTRELIAQGMDPQAARAAAVNRFGDIGAVGAECRSIGRQRDRDMRRTEYFSELLQDVRFALRQLRRTPVFSAIAVLTLALGVGATTAIFSAVNAVVLRRFPFAHPDRVVFVFERFKNLDGNVSGGIFTDWQQRTSSFEQLAAINFRNFNVSQGQSPERALGTEVNWTLFPALGVAPEIGRVFTRAEDEPGAADVVILSHAFWQRSFAGDRDIVGRTVQLNGKRATIVGVMPPEFDPTASGEQLWVPIAMTPERRAMHDEHYLTIVGLLKPGVSAATAQRDVQRVMTQLAREFPKDVSERSARIAGVAEIIVGSVGQRLLVILGAVACVLLIACGNVANLLMARGAARAKELAVRTAIGAGRGRIARQLLTESLVLSTVATATGLGLSWIGIRLLIRAAPPGIPRIGETRIDALVIAFAAGLAIVCSVVFGLVPAIRGSRSDLNAVLKEGGRSGAAHAHDRVRAALIMAQVGIALTLLVGAGLLIRSAINLQHVDPGFDLRGVVAARVALPATTDRSGAKQTEQAFERIVADLKSRPGVGSVAATSQAPMGPGGNGNGLLPEGKTPELKNVVLARMRMTTPGYLATMRIPLLRGRWFDDADIAGNARVIVVSASLANAAWPGENAIGKRIGCCEGTPEDPRYKTVIGIVGDIHSGGPALEVSPEFYLPVTQVPPQAWDWIQRAMTIVVRGDPSNTAAITAAIRDAVRQVDPGVPVYGVTTMEQALSNTLAGARFNTILLATLGVVGLLLAAAGIYSVVAYFVTLRTHEIGIRIALGADAGDVIRLMTWQGLRPIAAGIVVGIVGAYWATRLLAGSLYGVRATDPLTFTLVALVLVLVGATATIIPARRATRVDPTQALHA